MGFGAAAVETQDEVHGMRICDLREFCGGGCEEYEIGTASGVRSFRLERRMLRLKPRPTRPSDIGNIWQDGNGRAEQAPPLQASGDGRMAVICAMRCGDSTL